MRKFLAITAYDALLGLNPIYEEDTAYVMIQEDTSTRKDSPVSLAKTILSPQAIILDVYATRVGFRQQMGSVNPIVRIILLQTLTEIVCATWDTILMSGDSA